MASELLHLHILRHGDTLAMYFLENGPVAPRSEIPVEERLLTDIVEELGRLTNLANARLGLRSTEAPALPSTLPDLQTAFRHFGALLFRRLFPDAIRQTLRGTRAHDLVIHLHDQLVHVPWELAFDGEDFLLAKFHIGRQILVHDRLTQGRPAWRSPAPLRMLIIVDPTESLPAATAEAEQLCALLDAYATLDVDVIGGKQLRKLDLLQILEVYDIVHYAGHARFDLAHPERSGWVLHDNAVLTAKDLREVESPPLLVFSNACQAGVLAPWQGVPASGAPPYEPAACGIGSAFLLAGVQHYIGTFGVIHDRSSAAFAAEFYRHFLHGKQVGAALAAARQRARQAQVRSGLLWASYMHYGDPTFRLATAPALPPLPTAPNPAAAPSAGQKRSEISPPAPLQPPPLHRGSVGLSKFPSVRAAQCQSRRQNTVRGSVRFAARSHSASVGERRARPPCTSLQKGKSGSDCMGSELGSESNKSPDGLLQRRISRGQSSNSSLSSLGAPDGHGSCRWRRGERP